MLGLALVGVAVTLMTVTLGLGRAVGARHHAAAAADLAALAAIDSAEGCSAAARVAQANQARLVGCEFRADGTVVVTVLVETPGLSQAVRGTARAGPGPARMSPTTGPPEGMIKGGEGASW